MPGPKNEYTCTACGASFRLREDLIRHNANVHGVPIGIQLRQSEEIQKQREREKAKRILLDQMMNITHFIYSIASKHPRPNK